MSMAWIVLLLTTVFFSILEQRVTGAAHLGATGRCMIEPHVTFATHSIAQAVLTVLSLGVVIAEQLDCQYSLRQVVLQTICVFS